MTVPQPELIATATAPTDLLDNRKLGNIMCYALLFSNLAQPVDLPRRAISNQFDTSSPEEIADNKQQNVRTRFHEDAINSTSARAGGQTGGRVGGWAGGWVRGRAGRQAAKIKAEEA